MSNTPHTLAEEFPGQGERISALKVKDAEFALLLEAYDMMNDAVHLAETRVKPVSEDEEKELRRRRLALKDQIAGRLAS